MTISVDNEELKSLVDKKVDSLLDEVIKERIQVLLFDRVDGLFKDWKGLETLVEKIAREQIEKQMPELLDETMIQSISNKISSQLHERLSDSIRHSLYLAFMPKEEYEGQEDWNRVIHKHRE